MTVAKGADRLIQAMDYWSENYLLTSEEQDLGKLIVAKSREISDDPVLNLACYLKASCGACLHGMTDLEWFETARECRDILAVA